MKQKLMLFFILIASTSCGGIKNNNARELDFKTYLETRNINISDLDTSTTEYTDYYLEFIRTERKQQLENNTNLRVNEVYINKDNDDDYYVFQVYDDDGDVYIGSSNIIGESLSFPKNDSITITDPIVLRLLGFYELDKNQLKIERRKKSAYREWVENDIGIASNDSIHLTGWYYAKKYKYKKKWLAKTHKTDFRMRYAPNLKARKKPGLLNTTIFLIEEGTFKVD